MPTPRAPSSSREPSIETLAGGYVLAYIAVAVLTRQTASIAGVGHGPAGLEILPATTLLSGVLSYVFVYLSGWWRDAHLLKIGNWTLPRPTLWTAISGLGAAMVLVTVPLSFTFPNVSIPFMQLLMRGDVLLVAPLVDLALGRRVHWFSWLAIFLICIGLWVAADATRPTSLPLSAIATAALYTVGHLLRLFAMTKVAKTGDVRLSRGYFVEEKLIAVPAALIILLVWETIQPDAPARPFYTAFVAVWGNGQWLPLSLVSLLMCVTSIVSLFILLDRRENTFCVPFERSASVLAAFTATYVLAAMNLGLPPSPAELAGAGLLLCSMALLSIAPKMHTYARSKWYPL